MTGTLLRRTVKVTRPRSDPGGVAPTGEYSSGYAVGPDLVLTAGHGVGPLGSACAVAPANGTAPVWAEVVWRGDARGLDVAVLRLDDPHWTAEETATAFGEIVGTFEVRCVTAGFPAARRDPAGRRRIDVVPGRIVPANGVEDGRYLLDSTAIPPRAPHDPAQGHSGGAVVTADARLVLVGVAVAVPESYPTGRFEVVRAHLLLADPEFAALVGADPGRTVQVDAVPLPPGIVEHDDAVNPTFVASRTLRDDHLRYVPPPADSPFHPDSLLTQLDAAGTCGVVLVGAAGIGKTRTCLEVADRAVDAGWRVLHINPGDLPVTTEQLMQAVDSTHSTRLLFVVDYLNDSRLDFPALQHTLLPAAADRGVRVALLASARPAWYWTESSLPAQKVFRPVQLEPDDEQLTRIQHEVIRTFAPKASGILGGERLRELCGKRPIMVVLIAAEAEAQASEGLLQSDAWSIRPRQLTDWLRYRLHEDELRHLPRSALDVMPPSVELQTCAAMVAAMPQSTESVLAAGGALHAGDTEIAEALLDRLTSMGWVGPSGGQIGTVHDIVTDQLLETTTIREATAAVVRASADRVLSGALTRPRTFGRYALNLGRLVRDLELAGRAEPLRGHLAGWLAGHATEAGAMLAQEEDEGSYAIGAIIDSLPWSAAVFEHWDAAVGPWLRLHRTSRPARHLLYKGLRSSATPDIGHLVADARAWLDQHGTTRDASFVLHPLLGGQVDAGVAEYAVTAARAWLDQHGTTPDARFLLHPLLDRQLGPDVADHTVTAARAWLDQHGTTPDARFVLRPLLDPGIAGHAVAAARAWLEQHGKTPEAQYVLHPLLERQLDPDAAEYVITTTRNWLHRHCTIPDAKYVLRPLLERQLDPDAADYAVIATRDWLHHHGTTPEASFVLHPLLGRQLDADNTEHAVTATRNWLEQHGTTPDAKYVLRPLLERQLDPYVTDYAVAATRAWLEQHGTTSDAQFVLRPLLERHHAPGSAEHAVAWLDHHGTIRDACFVLRGLLGRRLLPPVRDLAVDVALVWLDHHSSTFEAGFVLPGLLDNYEVAAAPPGFLERVEDWLLRHAELPDAAFVVYRLERQHVLTARTGQAIVQGVLNSTEPVNVGWQLAAVAKILDRTPSLAGDMITAVERQWRLLGAEASDLNADSEVDGLFEQLCRARSCSTGVNAARLDDLLAVWLGRPESLVSNCSDGTYFPALVSRACALLLRDRFQPAFAAELLRRTRAWVRLWKYDQESPHVTGSLARLDQAASLLGTRGG